MAFCDWVHTWVLAMGLGPLDDRAGVAATACVMVGYGGPCKLGVIACRLVEFRVFRKAELGYCR